MGTKYMTAEKIERLRKALEDDKLTYEEASKLLGEPIGKMYSHSWKNGWTYHHNDGRGIRKSVKELEIARKAVEEDGYSANEVSKIVGVQGGTVNKWIIKYNWEYVYGLKNLKEWDAYIKQWRVPGFKTYSPREMEIYFGKPESWSKCRFESHKGELSREEFKHQVAPYWMPNAWQKKGQGASSHFLENRRRYEDAIVRLVDAGKSKDFVRDLMFKITRIFNGLSPSQIKRKLEKGERLHEYSITPLELLMLWPLDDTCPICKSTKMILKGEGEGKKWRFKFTIASVDRKKNEKGYASGNCGWVCYQCNADKGALTLEKVENIAAWIRSAE